MTMTKRLIRISLLLALIFSLLSACSGNIEDDPSATEQEESVATEPVEAEPPQSAPDEVENEEPAANEESSPDQETADEASAPEDAGSGDTWLIMLYQDADDEVLEKDIFIDLNEAEMVGSSEHVTIVSQIDRLDGGYDGDGDWSTAKRFLVNKDDTGDLEVLQSEELEDLGEIDMGDPQTLVEFAVWAMQTYPADKYALILSDHGAGWTGGWTDDDPNEGSQMFLNHIDEALAEITTQTGGGQLELVGFDACLMGQVDVLSAVAPYARYMIGSEETEPSLGWAYASFLEALTQQPEMTGAELSQKIVESYIDEDGRITDEEARNVFANEVFRAPEVSVGQMTEALGGDITLTAIDLSKLEDLNTALNELVMALQDEDQSEVAQARAYAQSYTSIFGKDTQPSYIDLGHFASLLIETFPDTTSAEAAGQVLEALQAATVAEKHGPDRPGSTGLTLYFPDGDVYTMTADPEMNIYYPRVSGRFAAASLWDDFLAFHYASNPIDPEMLDTSVIQAQSKTSDFTKAIDASALVKGTPIVSPGAGEVTFTSLTASAETITTQGSVTLSAELGGKNIGYVYIYTAYYDTESDSFVTTDLDFIGADETKQVGDVSYPDWGNEADLSLGVDWEPVVWTISDGTNDAFAAAEAETYGATPETTFYQVWGMYQMKSATAPHQAFLRFDANGKLNSVTIFTGPEQNAAPRKIIPALGDTFTVDEEWLEFDKDPEGEYVYYAGDTVTYGADGFTMVANEAMAGDYTIGIVVEDLEGTTYEKYIEVKVTE